MVPASDGEMPSAVSLQESQGRQALWVAPDSLADIEDEVVRTVQSSIMSDRGVDVKTDLQVSPDMHAATTDVPARSYKQEHGCGLAS